MVHWAFLILAFFAGAAACYGIIYHLGKVYDQVMGAIKGGAKEVRYR